MEELSRSLVITPAAQDDLADAIAWYESRHPDLSFDFRLALDATFSVMTRHPDSYAIVAPGLHRGLLRRFPHAVYYRHHRSMIEVVAILHTSRDHCVWQTRDQ